MAAADLLKWVSLGDVLVTEISGNNPNVADRYIQLHEVLPLADGTLANGAVPTFSLLAQGKNGFKYSYLNPIPLKELLVTVSTTEATYTAVGAGTALDMFLVVSGVALVTTAPTVTGNLTTGVDSITPYADAVASALKSLVRIDYVNNTNAAAYVMVFADPTVANGAIPLKSSIAVAAAGTLSMFFTMPKGDTVLSQDSAFVKHYGCYIVQSSTPAVLTKTAGGAQQNLSYLRSIHIP